MAWYKFYLRITQALASEWVAPSMTKGASSSWYVISADAKAMVGQVERSPLSLEKLSIQDDIVTYTTKDGAAHDFDALKFLAALFSAYS